MPDRQTPPPPPVVVAVTQDANGGPAYAGEDRRSQGDPRANVNVNVQPPPTPADQVMLHGIPAKWQGWVRLGTVGVLVVVAIIAIADWRSQNRRAEERDERRYLDAVELQRATLAQNARDMATVTGKFEALMSEIRAFSAKVDANGDRVVTARGAMEQMARKLEDLMVKVLAEFKRLVPAPRKPKEPDKSADDLADELGKLWHIPMFGVWPAVAPERMPELAPRPRATASSPR